MCIFSLNENIKLYLYSFVFAKTYLSAVCFLFVTLLYLSTISNCFQRKQMCFISKQKTTKKHKFCLILIYMYIFKTFLRTFHLYLKFFNSKIFFPCQFFIVYIFIKCTCGVSIFRTAWL